MSRIVKVHVAHLRRHLDQFGWAVRVQTVHRTGYLLMDREVLAPRPQS